MRALEPLRRRLGPGAQLRRTRKLERRLTAGHAPQGPVAPRDRDAEQKARHRWRAERAYRIRVTWGDEAPRLLRTLSLDRP